MRLSARRLFVLLFTLFTGTTLRAQNDFAASLGGDAPERHTQVSLIFPVTAAHPGDTVNAGLRLVMDPGWHTYWKNPGEAGEATTITWQLPPGVTADAIQWPLPHKLPPAEVTTYGYQKEVVLIIPLHLPTNLPAGLLNLAAKVTWLECKESCLPQKLDITATLNIGGDVQPSADAALLTKWEGRLPKSVANLTAQSGWEAAAKGDTRQLLLAFQPAAFKDLTGVTADFFPGASDNYTIESATESVPATTGLCLRKAVRKFSGDWPKTLSGLIVLEQEGERTGYEISLPIADHPPAPDKPLTAGTAAAPPSAATTPEKPLALILLYAFIGGLILNIMPCVLPVIALKILGFVNEAKSEPRRVRALGAIYAIGVLVSFLALAGMVIGLQSAGRLVGWGVQFSSPAFVISLTVLVTLVALNLFGLFEVTLGDRTSNLAGNLSAKHGAAGAFFNGALATALATPCTAPYLGYALGFAFAQPAAIIILIFLTSGLGLAAPYLLLSWNPKWLKFLPKPGAWMEKFKIAMGFPMLASALWLFTLAAGSLSKDGVLRFGLFLIALAFAAWVWGEFVQRGSKRRVLAGFVSLLLVTSAGAYAYYQTPDQINWQPWSTEAVAQARASGKPVLVDFTADWCLTCQVNKKTSIEVASVRAKINSLGAVALVGDYTHSPDVMTRELNKYHRAGVPLVLVFPADPAKDALVLPEVLTPGIVLDALAQAAK